MTNVGGVGSLSSSCPPSSDGHPAPEPPLYRGAKVCSHVNEKDRAGLQEHLWGCAL